MLTAKPRPREACGARVCSEDEPWGWEERGIQEGGFGRAKPSDRWRCGHTTGVRCGGDGVVESEERVHTVQDESNGGIAGHRKAGRIWMRIIAPMPHCGQSRNDWWVSA